MMNNTSVPVDVVKHFEAISATRASVIALMISVDMFVIVANIFMIVAISKAAKLRNSLSPLFVVNLCTFNLLAGGTVLPKSIIVYINNAWPWDHNTCIANGFFNTFFSFGSIFAICVITIDKFYCILFPMHHAGNMTVYKTVVLIILTWALAVVFATLPILGWNAYEFNKYSRCCWPGWRKNTNNQALTVFNLTVVFLLPATLIAIVNLKLYKIAKQAAIQVHPINAMPLTDRTIMKRERIPDESVCRISTIQYDPCQFQGDASKRASDINMSDNRISVIVQPIREMHTSSCEPIREAHTSSRETSFSVFHAQSTVVQHRMASIYRGQINEVASNAKAFKTLILSFASFTILWGPYFVLQTYRVMNESENGRHIVEPVATWLSYLSYAINPIVYGCFNSQIRNECSKLLQRLCCKKSTEDNIVRVSHINVSREDFFQFLERTCSND